MSTNRIKITDVRAGSVIVDFDVSDKILSQILTDKTLPSSMNLSYDSTVSVYDIDLSLHTTMLLPLSLTSGGGLR